MRLFAWVPGVTGPTMEIASFTLRTLLALALGVGAWLWFAQFVRTQTLEQTASAGS
jgi:hypothetical protein